jgi:tight adherence protein B
VIRARRRRSSLLAPLLGVGLLLLGWAAAPAGAQEGGEHLAVRAVDATGEDRVQLAVAWSGGAGDLDDASVTLDGEPVDVEVGTLADAGVRHDLAVVVDVSASTDANGLLGQAKEAVDALVDDLPPRTRVAVVVAGDNASTTQGLTDDVAEVRAAVDDLTPAGDGAVLAGVVRGATVTGGRETSRRSDVVPTVVLVTDGVESPSTSFEQAASSLRQAGAALYVVGLQDGGLDEASFGALAGGSGGQLVTTSKATEVAELVGSLRAELLDLGAISFPGTGDDGVHDLTVSVGGARFEGSYIAGATMVGAQRLHPRPGVEPGGIAFLRSDAGLVLGIVLAVVAVGVFVYALLTLFVREDRLGQALRLYGEEPGVGEDAAESTQTLAQTAFLQRAVAITEQFAQRQGVLARIEGQLERADLPLRAGEALFFYVAGVVVALALAIALTGNLLGGLGVAVLIGLVPPAALSLLATRKKRQFEALLPDTLQLLASTLRAGYSMMQGIDAVSEEAAEPMGKELRRVMTEARLGRPLEESLDAVAERMESPDFAWAVMAIRIQREVGGNLAELLLTVAETMTERERLRRDVSALTAEGRMSAYVLLGLPVGLCLFLYSINPDYIGLLFERTIGQMLLGAAAVMMVAGYVWMKKIITIEI